MEDQERKAMREHIVFLGNELEMARKQNQDKTELLARFIDREDLGWAVTDEVRKLAYALLTDDYMQRNGITDEAA